MSQAPTFDPQCFANHMGPWCIETNFMAQALATLRSGVVPDYRSEPYEVTVQDGTAVVPIIGPMMRGQPKFGGTGTVATSKRLNRLAQRDDVNRILLYLDTPGGTAAGTPQLARTVRNIRESGIQVDAHIENGGFSAGYYVASQAERITISPESFAGSIGVIMQLWDSSRAAALEGLRSVIITTSPFKAYGAEGEPITDEQVAYFRTEIEEVARHFFDAVQSGRRLTDEQLAAVTTGEVFGAKRALALGLVDAILPWEDAYQGETPSQGRLFAMAEQQETMVVPTSLFERLFGSRQEPKGEAVAGQFVTGDASAALQKARDEGFAEGKAEAEKELSAQKAALKQMIDICLTAEQPEYISKALEQGWSLDTVKVIVSERCAKIDGAFKIDGSITERQEKAEPVLTPSRIASIHAKYNRR